jgi:hypothetical protein
MRHCVLYEKMRLLQWLNLSFLYFASFVLLIALITVLRHNDTLIAYFACICWYGHAVLYDGFDYLPLLG